MPLALLSIPRNVGYVALAGFVGAEASGVPVPGETALIAASVLASRGGLAIEAVIPIAAAAAIVGDNIGYLLGARYGRRLLTRPGRTYEHRVRALARGDELFARHGAKAVFFGRWIAGLRVWAAWLAGMTTMPWRRFLVWNALGGMGWALCFGLVGYFGGNAVAHVLQRVGLGAAIAVVSVALVAYVALRRRLRA
ncbi:MAG: DedA family protein [Actinomycetota bacterium]|nr:DedA family protein [Actinomycetota bacterium]